MKPCCNHNTHPSRWLQFKFLSSLIPRSSGPANSWFSLLDGAVILYRTCYQDPFPAEWTVCHVCQNNLGAMRPDVVAEREVQLLLLLRGQHVLIPFSTSQSIWTPFKCLVLNSPWTQAFSLVVQKVVLRGLCVVSAPPWVESKNTVKEFLFTPPSISDFPFVSGICSSCLLLLLCWALPL